LTVVGERDKSRGKSKSASSDAKKPILKEKKVAVALSLKTGEEKSTTFSIKVKKSKLEGLPFPNLLQETRKDEVHQMTLRADVVTRFRGMVHTDH